MEAFLSSPLGYGLLFGMYGVCDAPELPVRLAADPEGNLTRIHVVYSADKGHFPGLLASMLSVARHSEAPGLCSIHIVVHAYDMERAEGLVRCFRRELAALPILPEVSLHELRPIAVDLSSLRGQANAGRVDLINAMTFAWFNVQEYVPSAPRALYLDTDTLVKTDLGPLYRMHMDNAVAGVPMRRNLFLYRYFPNLRSREHLIAKHVKVGRRKVHNSGVMVFDLAQWRSGEITRRLEEWLRLFDGAGDADQLVLNLEFQGKIDAVDWRWNSWGMGCDVSPRHCIRSGGVPRPCIDEAHILHFNGPLKPWYPVRGASNPHRHLFTEYSARGRCSALE